MEIRAFHAKDGDCLLIRGDDDTVILADGGRSTPFEDHVIPALADLDTDIDLVFVSHIDDDHISGIVKLIKLLIDWKVHELNPLPNSEPNLPRPSDIRKIWHNGFAGLINDTDGRIADALQLASQALSLSTDSADLFELYDNLTTGVASKAITAE